MTIKEVADELRERIGWSYTRLGEETGRSRQNVWMLLRTNDKNQTQIRYMVELLDAMGWAVAIVPKEYDCKAKYGESMYYEISEE